LDAARGKQSGERPAEAAIVIDDCHKLVSWLVVHWLKGFVHRRCFMPCFARAIKRQQQEAVALLVPGNLS
jgi:hypothetical protein